MAYVSTEPGTTEIMVRELGGAGRRWTVSGGEGGGHPTWSHDGHELYYRNQERIVAVSIQTDPDFYAGPPRVVLADQADYDAFSGTGSFGVLPDVERLLMNAPLGSASTRSLVVLLNWTEELNRLVPMKD